MVNDSENADTAVQRLEAALEKIARWTSTPPPGTAMVAESGLTVYELAERLDILIGRLHAVLGPDHPTLTEGADQS